MVTTVSGPEKGALATAAGAHHVVNYKTGDAAADIRELVPAGIDLVVEVAPAQNAALNAAVGANRASVAVYANNGGDTITAAAEVTKVHETKPVANLAIRITRQTGETVLEGDAWTYTARPA